MNNTLTAAEIKRRGMAAIEEGLRKGPVHIAVSYTHLTLPTSDLV